MKPDELQREEINHEGTKRTKKRGEENDFLLFFFALFVPSWFKFPFSSCCGFPRFRFLLIGGMCHD